MGLVCLFQQFFKCRGYPYRTVPYWPVLYRTAQRKSALCKCHSASPDLERPVSFKFDCGHHLVLAPRNNKGGVTVNFSVGGLYDGPAVSQGTGVVVLVADRVGLPGADVQLWRKEEETHSPLSLWLRWILVCIAYCAKSYNVSFALVLSFGGER